MMNFLSKVRSGDTVYFLGDLAWRDTIAELAFQNMPKKLTIHYIMGNHDKKYRKIIDKYCSSVSDLKTIKIEDQTIVLSHYAMRTWDKSHHGSWNFYGHSHGKLPPNKNQYDVGVDANNFYPISFPQVKDKIAKGNGNN